MHNMQARRGGTMTALINRAGAIAAAMTALGLAVSMPAFGKGPKFRADSIFQGSSLTGWQALGQADWKAQNGEIVGTPRQASGGWLVLDKSFSDVAFYADVDCT